MSALILPPATLRSLDGGCHWRHGGAGAAQVKHTQPALQFVLTLTAALSKCLCHQD